MLPLPDSSSNIPPSKFLLYTTLLYAKKYYEYHGPDNNNKQMTGMIESMTYKCFEKCAGTSGDRLDSKEQSCLANCQDRFLDVRKAVQDSLEKRQGGM